MIPTHAAFSKTQHQLESAPHFAAPKNLFDPRNSAFVELLDPLTHFPAPPFDGSSSSSGVDDQGDADAADGRLLEGLVLCGLRTELDLQVRSALFHINFYWEQAIIRPVAIPRD